MTTGFRTVVAAGEKFGKLTVLHEAPSRHKRPTIDRPNGGGRTRMIRCRCECGLESNYRLGNLTSGTSTACRSCGWRQRWVQPSLEDRAILLGCTAQELQLEVAWAAGLFEGEGTFTVSKSSWVGPSGQGKVSTRPRAALATTDEDVAIRFHRAVGLGRLNGPYANGPGRKPYWAWALANNGEFPAFLELMEPWLGSRRRARAQEVLQHLKEWPNAT